MGEHLTGDERLLAAIIESLLRRRERLGHFGKRVTVEFGCDEDAEKFAGVLRALGQRNDG